MAEHDTAIITPESLFRPFEVAGLTLRNRIVMAPMTRAFSPGGVPGADVAAYYARRAAGGVGLIITEGTWIPHPTASNDPQVPCFYGPEALAGWADVCRQVHAAGAKIIPQLWHVGVAPKTDVAEIYADRAGEPVTQIGPSGLISAGLAGGRAMDQNDLDQVREAYVRAAVSAFELGFDGVELHAAHGYLIDQFFWHETNIREDRYGGDVAARTRFAVEIIREIRAATSPNFPIILRFSQWKLQDYAARPWPTPAALEQFLTPLVGAGVDLFHCSQRRFWEPEFPGSDLNLAGWTRKITGKPTITVGSVTLGTEFMESLVDGTHAAVSGLDELLERLNRNEFDLVAVGRALVANPDWADKVRAGAIQSLRPFDRAALATLV